MTVQAWFSATDVEVAPGSSAVLTLAVTNLGTTTESYALVPSGLAAAWTTIRPAYVTLFGGSEQLVDVEVHPPRLPGTTAGTTGLGVRILPESDPNEVHAVETTLNVLPSHDRRIQVLQPAQRSRRRAVYELVVENVGNAHASCRLRLVDPSHRVDGDFDPPAVGVEPGGSTLVRLKVKARRRQWERRSRSIPFRVEAEQQGTPVVDARATFVQAPVLPERLWSRLAGVVLLAGALAGAWFALVLPAIDDAVDEAVADEVVAAPTTTLATGAPEVVTPTTAADTGDEPAVAPAPVTPLNATLASGATIGSPSAEPLPLPPGQRFLLTDIVIQNPAFDEGTAVLRIGPASFTFDLANLAFGSSETRQFVTPVEVLPGEEVVFEVTCAAIGNVAAGACTTTAFLSGELLPVEG